MLCYVLAEMVSGTVLSQEQSITASSYVLIILSHIVNVLFNMLETSVYWRTRIYYTVYLYALHILIQ